MSLVQQRTRRDRVGDQVALALCCQGVIEFPPIMGISSLVTSHCAAQKTKWWRAWYMTAFISLQYLHLVKLCYRGFLIKSFGGMTIKLFRNMANEENWDLLFLIVNIKHYLLILCWSKSKCFFFFWTVLAGLWWNMERVKG